MQHAIKQKITFTSKRGQACAPQTFSLSRWGFNSSRTLAYTGEGFQQAYPNGLLHVKISTCEIVLKMTGFTGQITAACTGPVDELLNALSQGATNNSHTAPRHLYTCSTNWAETLKIITVRGAKGLTLVFLILWTHFRLMHVTWDLNLLLLTTLKKEDKYQKPHTCCARLWPFLIQPHLPYISLLSFQL